MAENMHRTETDQWRLMATIAQRFSSGKYSDLTITCGNQSWQVHRVIVCFDSNFFATACDGNFLEAQNGKIDLPEDDPKIVDLVLQYLYKLDYSDDETSDAANKDNGTLEQNVSPSDMPSPPSPYSTSAATREHDSTEGQGSRPKELVIGTGPMLEHQKIHSRLLVNTAVYATADRLNIPGLKDLAAAKFEASAGFWPQHDFATIVSAVLDSTPANDRGLRPIIAERCGNHISEILGLKKPGLGKPNVDSKEWEEVLAKDGDFLYSILRQQTTKMLDSEDQKRADIAAAINKRIEDQDKSVKRGKPLDLITPCSLQSLYANCPFTQLRTTCAIIVKAYYNVISTLDFSLRGKLVL